MKQKKKKKEKQTHFYIYERIKCGKVHAWIKAETTFL